MAKIARAEIDPLRCDRSPLCPARRACPAKAIVSRGFGQAPVVDADKCTGCGICIRNCPGRAIALNPVHE